MDDDQIKEMIKELLKECDSDVWQQLQDEASLGEEDEEAMMERLVSIVKDHMEAADVG